MAEQQEINDVWAKGRVILGYDSNVWRHDSEGKSIKKDEYGKTTEHGWEIDHIKPLSRRGADTLANKQPLQWLENRKKADKVRAEDDRVF